MYVIEGCERWADCYAYTNEWTSGSILDDTIELTDSAKSCCCLWLVHSVYVCSPLSYCELFDECSVFMHSDRFKLLGFNKSWQILKWP